MSRKWLPVVGAVALALTFAQSPGQVSPDTKLDLTANPLRFLARATNLWNSDLPFGQAQNQAYGYLFPHGTFFVIGHLLGVPGWVTQRQWWAVLLTVGFWGLLRVAEALGVGGPSSRVVGAVAFALSPRVLTTLGSISSETLPMMLAPWVLLPTILALRGTSGRSVRALAAQAGLAVALMGAVNAIATLAGCLPAVIWWACHRPNRLWWRYTAWWLLAMALATLWWVMALTQLHGVSPPFLDFIESSGVTTQWSSLVEVLRGTDSWTPFVAPNATAGAPLVTGSAAILGTCLVAAAGLAGLTSPAMPARGRLVTMLLVGLPLGSSHTVADVRIDPENTDWDALAAAPGPLILQATASHLAESARSLIDHQLAESTPCVVTAHGTTCQQRSVETTLQGLTDPAVLGATDPACSANGRDSQAGPLIVTIGKTVTSRAKLNWWESRALYGWTVLVPRTKDQAGEMSERLTSYGALPVEVPTIAVEPPRSPAQMERAVKGLVDGRFQWIVFTSTNAVRAVWEKFGEFGLDARAFSGVKIACVGESTADRVRAFGISPELVPSGEQSSLGLLDDFPPYDSVFDPVNRVLLPRADIATETLAEGLRERGWEIEDVTAYRTVRAAPPPATTREMIKTGGFDAVCFTSSSTVRNLVGIAGKPHARTIIACIGPKTAETAAEFGLRVDVQPDTAAIGPLVDALAEHAARLRAEGALPPPRKKSRRR